MTIEDIHSLAAAYALDALDPDERRRFEAHYPDCDTCRVEVGEFRETTARVASADTVPVPPDLKARVMAEVGRTRQLAPHPTSTPIAPQRRWVRPVLAAAAIVAAVLVGAGVIVAVTSGDDGTDTELAQVLAAPDALTVTLEGSSDGTLRIVHSAQEGRAVMVGSHLTEPGDDHTYQLWAISDDTPRPAGVFVPNADGEVEVAMDAPSTPPDAWAVTVEPAGGSAVPTGEAVLQGTTA